MECCSNPRIALVTAKCSDLCTVVFDGKEHDGYVPDDMGIGGDDYVKFHYCLECGKIHGDWPLETPEFARAEENYEEEFPEEECDYCGGSGECPECNGGNDIPDDDDEVCEDCQGSGTCPECNGDGKILVE